MPHNFSLIGSSSVLLGIRSRSFNGTIFQMFESSYNPKSTRCVPLVFSLSVVCDSLCPMDCSLPGSFVIGTFQARIQEWVAIPCSRGSSHSGIEPTSLASPALAGDFSLLVLLGNAQVPLTISYIVSKLFTSLITL